MPTTVHEARSRVTVLPTEVGDRMAAVARAEGVGAIVADALVGTVAWTGRGASAERGGEHARRADMMIAQVARALDPNGVFEPVPEHRTSTGT